MVICSMASDKFYSSPAVQVPTVAALRESAARTGLRLTDDQLHDYKGMSYSNYKKTVQKNLAHEYLNVHTTVNNCECIL